MSSNIPIISFNGGLVTPHVDARIDSEKYQSACRVLNNFIARMYGDAERRPGTYYINDMWEIDDDIYPTAGITTCLLIPFVYSRDVAYVLEFTNTFLRVYYNDSVIDEIISPYAEDDLFELQFKQVGDVLRITHEDYRPKVLTRESSSSFAITDLVFNYGPFLKRNDLANPENPNNITMLPDVSGLASGKSAILTGEYGLGYWYDGNPEHGINGLNTDYCGGGWDGKYSTSSLVYTITFDDPTDIEQININYICMTAVQPTGDLADNTYTKRGLRVYDGESWSTIVDYTEANEDFTATSYADLPASLLGYNSNASLTELGLTGITKIEIYLWAQNPSGHHRTTATAIFNVSTGVDTDLETGTLTASANYFDEDMAGSLFYLVQPKTTTNANGYKASPNTGDLTSAILTHGTFTVSIHTGWIGKINLLRKQGLNEWENWSSWSAASTNKAVQQSYVEDGRDVYYKLSVESLTSGSVQGEIDLEETMQTGICRVTSYNSATEVEISVIAPFVAETATTRWAEGAWSDYRGFPSSCCFIEDRCVYGGMKSLANGTSLATVWLSGSGDYEDFDEGIKGADAFSITIETTETLQWVEAMDNLMVGTTKGTYIIRSSRMDSVLIPNPPPICRQVSAYPCDQIRPLKMMKTMAYSSGRQLRELAYDRGSYESDNDLTALCEQITLSPIVNMSLQTNPDTILWCVHEDGRLSALVYDRENNVIAWSKMPLALSGGGVTPKVKSVCVIPHSGQGDDIYIAVWRTITGSTIVGGSDTVYDGDETVTDKRYVIYIERFAQRFE
jgi:hypothetical protein